MVDASARDIETCQNIDRICDDFEKAWQHGQTPRIESSLEQFSPTVSDTLLQELLEIEFEYRLSSAITIDEKSYHVRFPRHADIVTQALASARSRPCRPDSGGNVTHDLAETPLWKRSGTPPAPIGRRTRIGDYEIIEVLGRGGMGIVYKARQISVNRIVALKIVRSELLQRIPAGEQESVTRRFVNEATAVARIEHEHVVRAYGAGCAGPLHYFAMQYVDGSSLAETLRQGPLPPRQAAEWMKGVAEALAAAHERGILHRDVKPANILIERTSQRALLVDFGLAKLIEDASAFTRAGELLGSPHYMSPEQAADASQVGCESDVYGLGASLYHALTGRPPFQASSPNEVLRQVQDDPPCEPRKLINSLPRDLETICLKCLEKSPLKRYRSATEVADELRRFLEGEPSHARPTSRYDRAARWCRRRPLAAALLATTASLLVTTLVATAVGLTTTCFALRAERRERIRAEENLGLARQSVDSFLNRLSKDPRLKAKGLERLRQELLAAATAYYGVFARQKASDSQILTERGRALASLGALTAELGDPQQAISHLSESIHVFEQLAERLPNDASFSMEMAAAHTQLAGLFHDTGQPQSAAQHCQTALRICESGENGPARRDFERLLVRCLVVQARLRENGSAGAAVADLSRATTCLENLLANQPQDPQLREELARCHNNLAILQRRLGELDRAKEKAQAAVKLWETLYREAPLPNRSEQLGLSANNLAVTLLDLHQEEGAGQSVRRSIELLSGLVAEHPDVPDFCDHLAASHSTLARLHEGEGSWDQAAAELRIAVRHYEKLTTDYPEYLDYQLHLAASLNNLGRLLLNSSALLDSERLLARAARIIRQVVAVHPERSSVRKQYALTLANLAVAYTRMGDHCVATSCWEDALSLGPNEMRAGWQLELAASHARDGQYAKAEALLAKCERDPNRADLLFLEARTWAICAAAAGGDDSIPETHRLTIASRFTLNAVSSLQSANITNQLSDALVLEELRESDDFTALRQVDFLWKSRESE
ncbi:MAG: protein kinase domain-containing protein [Pirellulaceae bacterium]